MSLPELTNVELASSFFGWVATSFGTWLLLPAYIKIYKDKPKYLPMNEIKYFGWWLGGDALHLTALLLEGAGIHQYILYIIIIIFEILILVTIALFAHKFWWQKSFPPEKEPSAVRLLIAGFTFSVASDRTKKRPKLFGVDERITQVIGTIFFLALGISVWLLVAYYRVIDLPAPRPSVMPHNPETWTAFVFAWIGVGCWVWPRLVVAWSRNDGISTASVWIGLGAHGSNMANIAILNFRATDPTIGQLPFFVTSAFCSIIDVVRLVLKKKNDVTPARGPEDPDFRHKNAIYTNEKRRKLRNGAERTGRKLRKEQGKIDRKRDRLGIHPIQAAPPSSPSSNSDDSDLDISTLREPGIPAGLPLSREERTQLNANMRSQPGQGTPAVRKHARDVIRELKEREDKLDERLEELLEQEFSWLEETKESKEGKGHKLDEEWYRICQEYGLLPRKRAVEEVMEEREKRLEHAKGIRQPKFGTIEYQILQTLRLVKFVMGEDDGEFIKLEEDVQRRSADREKLKGMVIARRRYRTLKMSPIVPSHPIASSSDPVPRRSSSSARRLPSPTLVDSANASPDTPTAPSRHSLSLDHRRRRSFHSDSSFSTSDSDTESKRSLDEEELLPRNRSSRSTGGRRYGGSK